MVTSGSRPRLRHDRAVPRDGIAYVCTTLLYSPFFLRFSFALRPLPTIDTSVLFPVATCWLLPRRLAPVARNKLPLAPSLSRAAEFICSDQPRVALCRRARLRLVLPDILLSHCGDCRATRPPFVDFFRALLAPALPFIITDITSPISPGTSSENKPTSLTRQRHHASSISTTSRALSFYS